MRKTGFAVERAKPVLPLAVRKRAVGFKAPVLIHAAVRRQFPDDVQQTAATQPHRLGVGDGFDFDVISGKRDLFDGAATGPHAAGDVHALEGRPGGGGRRGQLSIRRQHHFAVGADVHEQRHAALLRQLRRENAGRDVRAHISRHDRRQINLPPRRHDQTDVRRAHVLAALKRRRVGRFSERCRICRGGQMEHGGVAAEYRFVDMADGYIGFRRRGADETV